MKKLLFLLISCFVLISCEDQLDPRTVFVGSYSLSQKCTMYISNGYASTTVPWDFDNKSMNISKLTGSSDVYIDYFDKKATVKDGKLYISDISEIMPAGSGIMNITIKNNPATLSSGTLRWTANISGTLYTGSGVPASVSGTAYFTAKKK